MRANREERERGYRRMAAISVVAGVLLAVGVYLLAFVPAYVAYWNYSPQEGDVIFQSLPHSPLVDTIEGATECPYSHCAIVAKHEGRWVVYEALHNVEITPLATFVFRGRGQGFAVYRLTSEFRPLVPAILESATNYFGRPYDSRYRMDDERIYCSELVYKAFRDATGGKRLGELVRLGDLKWRPYEKTIEHYEGGPVPLDREMITPKHLAAAEQLDLVFAHNMGEVQRSR